MSKIRFPLKISGFQFAGIHAGIKENPHKLDLALIHSEVPAQFAATYTTNLAKAAPVLIDLGKKKGLARAVIVNSGNANACTGKLGLKNAQRMVSETARALKISEEEVYVSSTGKIGVQLPMKKVVTGIREISKLLSEEGLERAARAILTTDFFTKISVVQGSVGKKRYTLAGFAKGAGMIEPAMVPHATMLAYFVTDLAISSTLLQSALNRVVGQTFNCITVDGDMSTNDTAMILANGRAENSLIRSGSREFKAFEKNLEEVARQLALQMVKDGEGATKVVELWIKGAKNEAEAKKIAYTVARSQLVKTSFFGQDPNWGRLLAAIGYSGATFNPEKVDIDYGSVRVASRGVAASSSAERRAHEVMKKPEFKVVLNLNQGKSSFRVWTSDLTTDYVKLNAEYRT